MLLAGLSTGNKIGLAVVGGAFILFALTSALIIPKRRPDFPGRNGLSVFVLVSFVFFVAMLTAVSVFDVESEAKGAEKPGKTAAPAAGEKVAVSETEFKITAPAAKLAPGKVTFEREELRQDRPRSRRERPGRQQHREDGAPEPGQSATLRCARGRHLHAVLQRARPSRGRHEREAHRRLTRRRAIHPKKGESPPRGAAAGLVRVGWDAGWGGVSPAHRSSATGTAMSSRERGIPREGAKPSAVTLTKAPEKWPSG